ncbi:hypothetical protein BJ508DRAFT_336710, partial [Ascobolus immersus RN42]
MAVVFAEEQLVVVAVYDERLEDGEFPLVCRIRQVLPMGGRFLVSTKEVDVAEAVMDFEMEDGAKWDLDEEETDFATGDARDCVDHLIDAVERKGVVLRSEGDESGEQVVDEAADCSSHCNDTDNEEMGEEDCDAPLNQAESTCSEAPDSHDDQSESPGSVNSHDDLNTDAENNDINCDSSQMENNDDAVDDEERASETESIEPNNCQNGETADTGWDEDVGLIQVDEQSDSDNNDAASESGSLDDEDVDEEPTTQVSAIDVLSSSDESEEEPASADEFCADEGASELEGDGIGVDTSKPTIIWIHSSSSSDAEGAKPREVIEIESDEEEAHGKVLRSVKLEPLRPGMSNSQKVVIISKSICEVALARGSLLGGFTIKSVRQQVEEGLGLPSGYLKNSETWRKRSRELMYATV